MTEIKKRKIHTSEFKAKVGLEALLELKTGSEVEIHGRVDSITIRTALVLSPAELVRPSSTPNDASC